MIEKIRIMSKQSNLNWYEKLIVQDHKNIRENVSKEKEAGFLNESFAKTEEKWVYDTEEYEALYPSKVNVRNDKKWNNFQRVNSRVYETCAKVEERKAASLTRIKFTPYAWSLLSALCREADTEIGCYGVTNRNDPLLIENLFVPEQVCNEIYNDFDTSYIANNLVGFINQGYKIQDVQRIWIHTHPQGMGATPSHTDEETFSRIFTGVSHGAMVILSKRGDFYGRIKIDGTFSVEAEVPLCIQGEDAVDEELVNKEAKAIIRDRVTQEKLVFNTPTQNFKTKSIQTLEEQSLDDFIEAELAKYEVTEEGGYTEDEIKFVREDMFEQEMKRDQFYSVDDSNLAWEERETLYTAELEAENDFLCRTWRNKEGIRDSNKNACGFTDDELKIELGEFDDITNNGTFCSL